MTRRRLLQLSVMLLLLLLTIACGFQLRGQVKACDDCVKLKSIQLLSNASTRELSYVFKRAIAIRGQKADKSAVNIRLNLQRETIERKLIAIDSSSGWQEMQITYRLLYDTRFEDNVSGTQQLVLIRSFTFKPASILGAEAESEVLMEDIRKQAADQLLDKLNARF